ncbi:MAG: hypothetical protein WCI54_05490 [Bacteroidia bacterium]
MKKQSLFILLTFLVFVSCNSTAQKKASLTSGGGIKYVKLTPINITGSGSVGQYKGYEITDPGINNISAIILQIPNDWHAQNSFARIWNGSTPINQIYVKAVSGDNNSCVEILPYTPYYYADGPTARSLRETSRSMGLQQQYQPFELPPMDALFYLKQYVLPRLYQQGLRFQITGEQNLGIQNQFKGVQSKHAFVDGRMQDGKLIRVECGVTLNTSNLNGEAYYNWSALPAIITSTNNLDAGYDVLKHMRSTIIYNPEWEQKVNELNRRGNVANAEISQKDFENVRNYREAINTIHQGISNDRNNSNDRKNESVRDVLGGEAKFENPNNGERVRLDDQYKHYYTDAQGNYYGSYEPLDYKAMSLTEVNRLDTKKY